MKAGVIDPTKVPRTALQNTASIAGLMLTTEAMISEIPEKKDGIEMPRWEIMFATVDGDHCVEETIRQHS